MYDWHLTGTVKVMFAMFNNIETWLAPQSDTAAIQELSDNADSSSDSGCSGGGTCLSDSIVNTNVITVSVGLNRAQSVSLTEPIRFVLEHKQVSFLRYFVVILVASFTSMISISQFVLSAAFKCFRV
jgi:hypothetical protein